ncbi:DegT/DnrJ/EryC1/StrS aminotransferase family protein [Phormidesmis priestleyi ULC007]|uniref:DegT/DnrJ/EryC1/StrS aminotransferase family protein n=1 Tax=Phormidesmis priestleyi ULC007 TaxID=1920490 RepID=A0A2T1DP31_9CYAN|nr:DegT/DnrJ/EryC1/StrS aminotransferase family protein [Phormidesmis priestleyi]PSB22258.1 DegT/DnrJ/EryC1/StrS aminotransferase family protein [Phormidesmis priestleyi ULC007]PZO55120.1 MAG: DegT/DnrJ/EryC1/StrS aminotransferase family protein [Phormidesmis priestleyi]
MQSVSATIPFVDLLAQHQPLQDQIEQAIRDVMQRGDYVLGQALREFEQAFAAVCRSHHGIGVACGTDAIALGLQACGIGKGDEVILPANTFIATLIGVLRSGATPVLVDCEAKTALIDLAAAEKAITPKTRAIVPVHLYGQMVSPSLLLNLAHTYDLMIFEDAAQAHLAEREGYRAGSIGVAAAFSFYPAKNLGALGDGGMVITHDESVAQKLRSLRNYGAPRKYFHTDQGTNSRLDTIQAAVLNVKLPYLAGWNRDRVYIADQYNTLLKPLHAHGILPIQNQCGKGHAYHLYVIRVVTENRDGLPVCALDREALQAQFAQQAIQTGIHYPLPCHLQPAFQELGYRAGDFPIAETLCQEILSLPMYPGLSDLQIHRIVDVLEASLIVQSALKISA